VHRTFKLVGLVGRKEERVVSWRVNWLRIEAFACLGQWRNKSMYESNFMSQNDTTSAGHKDESFGTVLTLPFFFFCLFISMIRHTSKLI
jgi:hypothetical protein